MSTANYPISGTALRNTLVAPVQEDLKITLYTLLYWLRRHNQSCLARQPKGLRDGPGRGKMARHIVDHPAMGTINGSIIFFLCISSRHIWHTVALEVQPCLF